ncbi:MAG: DeoR family transcriptional regulator [Patescibacteria group bacterium]|nr:DeoR family transcriptional regulator [Patescibacteria group bacterium]
MDKNRVIEAINELYRLTLLFPKKEPLRFKMREIADEILANFVTYFNSSPNTQNPETVKSSHSLFEVLDSFFEVAKQQNWVKPIDVLNLQDEYRAIEQEIKKEVKQAETINSKEPEPQKQELEEPGVIQMPALQVEAVKIPEKIIDVEQSKAEVSERQKVILDILKQKEGVQVWEVKDSFPDISKRTLRRDFRKLLEDGLVEREGERNTTFYKLKSDRT